MNERREEFKHIRSFEDTKAASQGCKHGCAFVLNSLPQTKPSPTQDSIVVCRAHVAAVKVSENASKVMLQSRPLLRECPLKDPDQRECVIAKLEKKVCPKIVFVRKDDPLINPIWSYFLSKHHIEDLGVEIKPQPQPAKP